MNLGLIQKKAGPIFSRYGVVQAFIFGSFARGEETENSDIDLLIEYAPNARKSMFDFCKLIEELKDEFGRDVDVVTIKGLSPFLRDIVDKEKRVIYDNKSA
ncbi:nucleotidyltransferase family protein [Heliorestis acidaminivorans]|uniref:Nucleotidyltransferase family protein n=1 Tax=Heliorestis acidaminivorans TaxID=553427 RepID=A0A6I0ESN5_9FIRM|nr:nucleotidyltransferase family protein [Heliorestis acidaminivorans]KAB2951921.1 nucleotidyltransferase family protein [Heliorestis acidaminivorans]